MKGFYMSMTSYEDSLLKELTVSHNKEHGTRLTRQKFVKQLIKDHATNKMNALIQSKK